MGYKTIVLLAFLAGLESTQLLKILRAVVFLSCEYAGLKFLNFRCRERRVTGGTGALPRKNFEKFTPKKQNFNTIFNIFTVFFIIFAFN